MDRKNSMASRFNVGDRVRIDIPDEVDPDHERLHGRRGEVIKILEDDAGAVTGEARDTVLYRVQIDNGTETDVRWRDLRPP
jgi:ribosomal protein L21E